MFQETGHTTMQLIKQLRLEACRRSLQDPALRTTSVKDIIAVHGYRRPDRFARDYRQMFGFSATRTRGSG